MKKSGTLNFGILVVILSLFSFAFAGKAEAKQKHPLVGAWTLQYESGNRPVVCYKLLKKNGRYVNLKSVDWDGNYFSVSREGTYSLRIGEYTEHLKRENGRKCRSVHFPLRYEFVGPDTVKISYRMGCQVYEETWQRAAKAPKYHK